MPDHPRPVLRDGLLSSPVTAPGRAMFTRTLQSWASDLMELRRRGLDRPGFRRGAWYRAGAIEPAAGARSAEAA